jgi:hypothetical protein
MVAQATQVTAENYVLSVSPLPLVECIDEIATLQTAKLREQLLNHIGAFSLYHGAHDSNDHTSGLPTDWHLEQQLDQEISYVVRHRNLNHREPPSDLNDQPDDVKRLWSMDEQLSFEVGCLCYRPRKAAPEYGHDERTRCLVVPK